MPNRKEVKKKKVKKAPTHSRASTSDVLGGAAPGDENDVPPKWLRYFRRLIKLRDDFVSRKALLSKDAREEQPAFSMHMADAGTDSYDRDFALSMMSSEQEFFYEVEQALRRIRDGTYGTCEATGKPISRERLNAIPWARFSVEAESELEKQGKIERVRLAPREDLRKAQPPALSEDDRSAEETEK